MVDVTGKYWSETRRTSAVLLHIVPYADGQELAVNYTGTPLEVTGKTSKGNIRIYYDAPQILHIESDVDLHLKGNYSRSSEGLQSSNTFAVPGHPNTYRLGNQSLIVSAIEGNVMHIVKEDEDENEIILRKTSNGKLSVVLDKYNKFWVPRTYQTHYRQTIQELKEELLNWDKSMPSVPSTYRETGYLASYINWSCVVEPRGNLSRPGMLMSKNWMYNIWSWDHCFNALSLSYHDPELSWDQWIILFDHQDGSGAIPDCISAANTIWGTTKPPIHGWILSLLMKNYKLSDAQKAEAYQKLKAWTDFWFICHDEERNGIPQYYSGAGSGWDNGTPFDKGCPLESPDLLAYLIIQMDVLEDLADQMGKLDEAKEWKKRSDQSLVILIKELWNGERFIARKTGTLEINEDSRSLMSYLPLILGKKLPEHIISKMVSDLKKKDSFISEIGILTESAQSTLFKKDGYWRGPVWAPSTMVMAEALRKVGETSLSQEISEKYCNACKNNGFGENFNALTGKVTDDPAYTWTTSVFLVLAHEYIK